MVAERLVKKITKDVCLDALVFLTGVGVIWGFGSFGVESWQRDQAIQSKYPTLDSDFTIAKSQAIIQALSVIPQRKDCFSDDGGYCVDQAKMMEQQEKQKPYLAFLERESNKTKYQKELLDAAIPSSLVQGGALTLEIVFLISQSDRLLKKNILKN